MWIDDKVNTERKRSLLSAFVDLLYFQDRKERSLKNLVFIVQIHTAFPDKMLATTTTSIRCTLAVITQPPNPFFFFLSTSTPNIHPSLPLPQNIPAPLS